METGLKSSRLVSHAAKGTIYETEELCRLIPKDASIGIYGLGNNAKTFYDYIIVNRPDVRIAAFFDPFATQDKMFDAIHVYGPPELIRHMNLDMIVICSTYHNEIAKILQSYGVRSYLVHYVGPLHCGISKYGDESLQHDGVLTGYAAPANNCFCMRLSLRILMKKRGNRNFDTIVSACEPFAWMLGIGKDSSLRLWIGNSESWNVLSGVCISRRLTVGKMYVIKISRTNEELSVDINGAMTFSMKCDSSLNIPGARLGLKPRNIHGELFDVELLDVISEIDDTPVSSYNKKRIDIVSFFWGKQFCDMLARCMTPSLFLSGNLNDLADYDIIHKIYCTEDERELLADHVKFFEEKSIPVSIDTECISKSDKKGTLHLAILKAIRDSAERNSIIVMAQPDHVFFHGLSKVIRTMKPFDYIVCGHPRISLEKAIEILPKLLSEESNSTAHDNARWVHLCMTSLAHPMVNLGLSSWNSYWHARRGDAAYSVFFKEPPPLCFYGTYDLASVLWSANDPYSRFETLDHELVDFSYFKGRLRLIDNSDEFFWAELTHDDTYREGIFNDYWSKAAIMCSQKQLRWRYK